MDRSKQLGEESISSLLLKFSIPAIVGMLVNALYNIIDRIFVGRGVGPLAISATSIAFPVSTVIMAFGMLVGLGATSLVSLKLGQNKKDDAEVIVANSFVLLVIISIIMTVAGFVYIEPILKAFGAEGEVLVYAKQFTTIIIGGIILQNLSFGMNNLIRAQGSPKEAMFTMLIGAILNTILNPIFIFGFKFGIRGSALATVISQAVSAIWVQSYFFGNRSMLKMRKKNFRLRINVVLSILSIGVSPFLMQIASSVITIILNKSLKAYGGDMAVAAIGIINSISMLILMPVFGINQGAQPIIGFNYGAEKYERVKHTYKLAVLSATAVTTFGFVMIELFPSAIMSVFTDDASLIKIGANGLRIFLMMLPFIGFQVVSSNYFQAIGKPTHSIFLSLSRQVIVLIPLLLILPGIFKLNGVWAAGPASDFISTVITAFFMMFEIRRLNSKHSRITEI